MYKDNIPVNVEIWDSVGLERYNEMFVYSQSYVQGKHGVLLLIDADDSDIADKIEKLANNGKAPICVIINKESE